MGGASSSAQASSSSASSASSSSSSSSSSSASSSSASSSSASASASSGSGGPVCDLTPLLGTWTVTTYACGSGAPTTLPPGFTFTYTATGNPADPDATFTQNNFGACVNSNTGNMTCDGTFDGLPAIAITSTGTPTCTPANCLANNQCNTPTPALYYTYQLSTVGGVDTLTTTTLPGTALTTCTSLGQPNPVTFTWVHP